MNNGFGSRLLVFAVVCIVALGMWYLYQGQFCFGGLALIVIAGTAVALFRPSRN